MNFVLDWQLLSQQWLLTLVHFLWQAAAVGLVLGITLRFFAGASARARYVASCIALASLPLCVLVTLVHVNSSSEADLIVRRDRLVDEAVVAAASPGLVLADQPNAPVTLDFSADLPLGNGHSPPRLTESSPTPLRGSGASAELSWQDQVMAWSPSLMVVYCLGVGFMLSRLTVALCSSHRVRAAVRPITDSAVLQVLAEQAERLRLRRVPLASVCSRVSVPMVVGVLQPMILLPPALLCGLAPQHLAAILAHEMAHIRYHDLIVNLCQRVVEALLFFHPVTWWISRQIRIERENCCDDLAAARTGPLPYASALLQMAELCLDNDPRRSTALAGMSADGEKPTDLGYRIRRLLGAEDSTRLGISRRGVGLMLVMIAGTLVSMVAWGQSQDPQLDTHQADALPRIFTPSPDWQTHLAANEGANEMQRYTPVVVAGNRVLTSGRNLDLATGTYQEETFPTLDNFIPVYRRKSSDRQYILEIGFEDSRVLGDLPGSAMRVFRASDGKQRGVTIQTHRSLHSEFAADVESRGNFALLGDREGVQVYRIETGAVETTLPVQVKRVDAVAFSPDQEWLVVSDQNDLHFWRWRDQAPVKTIHAGRKIDCLVFTPDGQYLAEGPDVRKDIQIRDMRTLEIVASLNDEVDSPLMVSSMDISPNGRFLVAHNEVSVDPTKLTIPHRVLVWDLKTSKPVFQIATGEWVRHVSFSDDGQAIFGEFSGAAHGTLLALWRLPAEVISGGSEPPSDAKTRLGDGIQWSKWGDKDGLLSGARLVLPRGGLRPGEPLVVEYRLANVSDQIKTIQLLPTNGMRFPTLSRGNRIGGFGLEFLHEPKSLTIEPGGVYIDSEHLVSIDTTGLQPGQYEVALGAAFFYPDEADTSITHHIPHRGSIPLLLQGESPAATSELPESDIHWGPPIAGLRLGATWDSDHASFAIGSTASADLFVANVSGQAMECSVELPHPGDGWLFNVEDPSGSTVRLERMFVDYYSVPQYIHLNLAAGEIARITGDGLQVSISRFAPDSDTYETSKPKVALLIVGNKDEAAGGVQGYGNFNPRLVSQGGEYQMSAGATLLRPDIPNLRLQLESADLPFSVITSE